MTWLDDLKEMLSGARKRAESTEGAESAENAEASLSLEGARPVGGDTSSCPSTAKCREAMDRLFEYLDGELDGATEAEIAEHFRVCTNCYPALAFEESFREALLKVRPGQPAPQSVRDRVLEVLQGEGFEPR